MASKTFDELWKHFLPDCVHGLKTEERYIYLYETYVQPEFGKKVVSKVDYSAVNKFHRSMKDSPYQANRVLALMKTMFKHSQRLKWTVQGENPAALVKMFPEKKRQRHMSPAEAPVLATIIRDHETDSPIACLYLWLLIFTGARPSEICRARWKDVIGNAIILDKHKTDTSTGTSRMIVLPEAAMAKLISLGDPDKTNDSKIIPLARPDYIWRTIRFEAGCPDMRIYDLRHTFATYALEAGYTLDQIGEALAHSDPKTTKIYAEMSRRSRQRITSDVSLAILLDMKIETVEVPLLDRGPHSKGSSR